MLCMLLSDLAVVVARRLSADSRTTADFCKPFSRPDSFFGPVFDGLGVIAEVKRFSLSGEALFLGSAGDLAEEFVRGGASSISVVSEPAGFGGSAFDVSEVVSRVSVPVLFKGIILDKRQVLLASSVGSHAVSLMVSVLNEQRFCALYDLALSLSLTPVIEASSAKEISFVLALRPNVVSKAIILVDSRKFDSFGFDAARFDLLKLLPQGQRSIAASGFDTPTDLSFVRGFDGVLVGSAFSSSVSPASDVSGFVAAF